MTPTLSPILAQATLAQEVLKKYFFSSIGASSQAADSEDLFMYIMWVNIISFVMLMVLLVWFILKYHRSKQATNYQVSPGHNTPLELSWSIIPLLIMVPIFYWGFTGFEDKLAAPTDSEEILVTGRQWKWSFVYRNGASPQSDEVALTKTGATVPDFIVPLGRPVKLIMSSHDVIHSFYISDFRTKMDVIPNRYTSMWFLPQKLTDMTPDPITGMPRNPPHKVFCTVYCGPDHSDMGAQMRVVSQAEYEKTIRQWLDFKGDLSLLEVGKLVYTRKGCYSCHSIDGTKSTGPTWKNLYGDRHEYTDGTVQESVDENSLRGDILYSQKRILKTYPTSMPVFAGQLNDLELDAVILYIKSLSDKYKSATVDPGKKTVKEVRDAEKAAKEGGATPTPATPPTPPAKP